MGGSKTDAVQQITHVKKGMVIVMVILSVWAILCVEWTIVSGDMAIAASLLVSCEIQGGPIKNKQISNYRHFKRSLYCFFKFSALVAILRTV